METKTILKLAKEKQPDPSLLCHLAKKITPTPAFVSETFLPFFKKLDSYDYEIQVQLSEVYGIHGTKEQNAYWLNNTKLIPVVAHHWLMNQLMVTPQAAITDSTIYQIKNALHQINCHTRQQLEGLLETLILQNHNYDHEIILLLERGIKNTKLTYKVSEKILHYLLTSLDYEIVFSTCELIKKYPFIFSIIPEVHLRRVMERGGLYEPLALRTLGIWGNNRIFEEIIQGESWQLESKRAVLPFLPLSTSLMNTLAEYLKLHPTYSLEWLDGLLRGADQGIYTNKKRIAVLVEHYFEYEFISAKQLVQLVGEASKEHLFNFVAENKEVNFQKKIKLYKALNTPFSRKEIVRHLKEIEDPTQLNVLLEAIAELKISAAASYVFPHLLRDPRSSLETLRCIGGTKTIAHLKELLEFDAPVKQNIPFFENEALRLLADLVPNQQIIINYLQKQKLPPANLPNLRLAIPVENESYLLEMLEEEEIGTVRYGIEKLGELGTLKVLEPIIKKVGLMDTDYANSAWSAAKKIVNRAYLHHQIRTKTGHQETAVNTVLTEVLLKQFESPLSSADATLYLNYISDIIPNGFSLEKISILAASSNPHIIKFYISYLGKINTQTAIKQLKEELKISQNIYTLRQALLALTELKNTSLENLVIPLLGHPNMNIKKTAAAYLSENGTVKAVAAMIDLYQRNDNTGLRAELDKGLENILGAAYYFFLFNECFPCEVGWQRQLLENRITDDEAIKPTHYIDFPELNTIAPLEKIIPDPKADQKFITKWNTIRSRTKEDLAQFEKWEDLLPKIETITEKAEAVFITDLIAASLRKLEKIPRTKNFKTILTSEEARVAEAENETDDYLWETLLLDPKNEKIEYDNLISYKEYQLKEKLFFHFLPHYDLQKIFTRIIEENQQVFLKRLLLNHKIPNPKYLPVFTKFHDTHKKQEGGNMISSLETMIRYHSFKSEIDQETRFFLKASTEEKIKKMATYHPQLQSVLKEEILSLYNAISWKERRALLKNIKGLENHPALFELSFKHHLEGKILSDQSFNPAQIQQFEKHPDAIELTKEWPRRLPIHSNEFILTYVKEIVSDQEADPSLLTPFRQLSTERKWEILKIEIEEGNWYWFSFFHDFAPINSELIKWFRTAPSAGKLEFIKSLLKKNKPLYFPNFEKELLPFIKESKESIAWQLLFNLQLKNNEKELTTTFTNEYADYNTSTKTELLTHLLHTIPTRLVNTSIFNKIVPTDKKEEILLIQLALKTLDYKIINTDKVVSLIKQIAKQDTDLAKQSLTEILESSIEIGLEKQMEILSGLYAIPELDDTITTQIADLFSTERLALSFLSEAEKKKFFHQVGAIIKVDNTELDKKRLLKNLADESPEEIKPLLMDILSTKKKTELDSLCLRLLKKTTARPAYLEICYNLLSSEKENLFPSIIRTLSFAKYTKAIPTVIKLLTNKTFSKEARKGLLIFGEAAIPQLTKEVNKVRPDKRNMLQELIIEIESRVDQ